MVLENGLLLQTWLTVSSKVGLGQSRRRIAGIYSCLMSNDNYAYKLDIESCCDFLLIHYSDVYFYVGF